MIRCFFNVVFFEIIGQILKCAIMEQSAILTIGKDKAIHHPNPFSSLNPLMRDDHAQDRLAENAGRFLFHEVGRSVSRSAHDLTGTVWNHRGSQTEKKSSDTNGLRARP